MTKQIIILICTLILVGGCSNLNENEEIVNDENLTYNNETIKKDSVNKTMNNNSLSKELQSRNYKTWKELGEFCQKVEFENMEKLDIFSEDEKIKIFDDCIAYYNKNSINSIPDNLTIIKNEFINNVENQKSKAKIECKKDMELVNENVEKARTKEDVQEIIDFVFMNLEKSCEEAKMEDKGLYEEIDKLRNKVLNLEDELISEIEIEIVEINDEEHSFRVKYQISGSEEIITHGFPKGNGWKEMKDGELKYVTELKKQVFKSYSYS